MLEESSEKLTVKRESVNAAVALEWLTENTHNRSMNDSWVAHLASEMSSKRWQFNGETVIFDDDGQLMDGQHRLQAIFEADAVVDLLVVRGVQRSAFHTIDTGRARSAGDVLNIDGYAYGHTLASAVAWLYRIENGQQANKQRIPHSVTLGYMHKHPEIISSLAFVQSVGVPPRIIPKGIITALHAYLGRVDREGADRFIASLLLGTDLGVDSPILKLRDRFQAASSHTSQRAQRLEAHERLALTIKVWNAIRSGKQMKVLVYRHRGKGAEAFPKPI